jgi:hypothetical protein
LNEDFIDFLLTLAKHQVEFMVIGGHAYVLHVQSRYTKDLDVWVNPTADNLERLRRASIAFANVDFSPQDALDLLSTSRLGFPLVGLEPNLIEILLRIKNVDFVPAYARAVRVKLRDLEVSNNLGYPRVISAFPNSSIWRLKRSMPCCLNSPHCPR